ncbi:hypothetical protein TKK_0001086 [Trichogramma kaykai]
MWDSVAGSKNSPTNNDPSSSRDPVQSKGKRWSFSEFNESNGRDWSTIFAPFLPKNWLRFRACDQFYNGFSNHLYFNYTDRVRSHFM